MILASQHRTLQDAVDTATRAGGGRVHVDQRVTLDRPLVLPRTTPVSLTGDGPAHSRIAGTDTFPPDRALIEWDPAPARAWQQQIRGLALAPPHVHDVRGIHYRRTLTGTTTADYSAERSQFHLADLSVEGNTGFHDEAIRLEGQVFFSTIERVEGDYRPSTGEVNSRSVRDHDTTLLSFEADLHDAPLDSDLTGFSYGAIRDCRAGMRRGGWFQLLRGRMKLAGITDCWVEGGRGKPGVDLRNSFSVVIDNVVNEGRKAAAVRVADSAHLDLRRLFVGSQDPPYEDWTPRTVYVAHRHGVIATGWRSRVLPPGPANNNWFLATTTGTTGDVEPDWPTTIGGTVRDGDVVWECRGPAVEDVIHLERVRRSKLELLNGSRKPTASSRGVKVLRLVDCDAIDGTGAVAGDPREEIAWGGTTGSAVFTDSRTGNVVRLA